MKDVESTAHIMGWKW